MGFSRCLAGYACTYKASDNLNTLIHDYCADHDVVLVCPECEGGLSVPRDPSEIVSRTPLCVMSDHGRDVTQEYVDGSKKCLEAFKAHGVTTCVLKSRSPSCGRNQVYDGTFSHQLIKGHGVFAGMCLDAGIEVLTEEEVTEEEVKTWDMYLK